MKRQRMIRRIEKHGQAIIKHFDLNGDPLKLCKSLRRLESKSHKVMLDYCNGDIDDSELQYHVLNNIKPKLEKILGVDGAKKVYINQDPRGYALKLNMSESGRIDGYKDWGGYFILAPDLSQGD